ncbi:MAG: ester cyclase [Acidobacteriota bacterium]
MSVRTSNRISRPPLAWIVMASAAITGCSTTNPDRSLERNKALVRQMNAEVWNKANVDALTTFFTPDFVLHFLPDGSETKGIPGLREHVRELHDAFPDWSEDIRHIVAEGDLVVIHYVSGGTNQGQWLGKPPTGRRVRLNEMSIFRLEDGRIAEQWLLPDLGSMQQQLAGTGNE